MQKEKEMSSEIKDKQDKKRPCNVTLLQWKTVSITLCECVFVALGIQHALRMRHIVIHDLSGSTTFFFHIIS